MKSLADLASIRSSLPRAPRGLAAGGAARKGQKNQSGDRKGAGQTAQQGRRQSRSDAAQKAMEGRRSERATYHGSVAPQQAWTTLEAIVDAMFFVRGMPGAVDLAEYGLRSGASELMRSNGGLAKETALAMALDNVVREAGANAENGANTATRLRRCATIFEGLPAVSDVGGSLLKMKDGAEPEVAEGRRSASSVIEQWMDGHQEFAGLTEELVGQFDVAKVSKPGSIRQPHLRRLRNVLPDFGVALAIAFVKSAGWRDSGFPQVDLARLRAPTLRWMDSVLTDLHSVVSSTSEDVRIEVYAHFIEGDVTGAEVVTLRDKLKQVNPGDGASQAIREKARRTRESDPAAWDAREAAFKEAQRLIDAVQAEAIRTVDDALALVRLRADRRADRRAAQEAEGGRRVRSEEPRAPRVVAPATRESLLLSSTATPDDALAQAVQEADVEVEVSIPTPDTAAIGLAVVSNRAPLKAAGLDGLRQCVAYPGVLWEAIMGPLDHAFDMERGSRDVQQVVIAPRKVGDIGLDLTQARVLMVTDYEDFFEPVPAAS